MASTNHGIGLSFPLKRKQFELRNRLNQTQIYQRHGQVLATSGEVVHDKVLKERLDVASRDMV